MKKAFNNIGISDDSNEAAANYDDVGDSFSAQALAAGAPNALTPGAKVTIGQTTFTWPNVAAGTRDNVVTSGQTVDLSGHGSDLGFLGSSQNGTASGTVTVNYTDGSSKSFNLNMADWFSNAPAVGDQLATTTSSWNFQQNSIGSTPGEHLLRVGAARAEQDGGVGHLADPEPCGRDHRDAHLRDGDRKRNRDHGRAIPLARGGVRQCRNQRQLEPRRCRLRRNRGQLLRRSARRRDPDAADGRRSGDDRGGAVHLAERRRRSGQCDCRRADHRLVGVGQRAGLPGSAGFGAATGSGTITYTDGSTQSYSISMADWYNDAPVSGDQIATTTTTWNFASSTQTPHPVSVYFASVPLDPNKTVASVTLPTVGSGVGNGINAMHIFSIGVGNGTPTSGG